MEDTASPDASPADGDRRATMKRQKTAEPPPEEPLLDALVNRDEAAALALLTPDSTLDVNFRAAPLRLASQHGLCRAMRALLRLGARVDAPAVGNGFTPLIAAAYGGHVEAVELLLRWGAPLHACDSYGTGAIGWAQANDNHAVALLLGDSARVLRLREEGLALGDDELPAAARGALREAIRRDESDRREAEASVREEEAAQEAADTLVASVSKNASEVSLASAETRSPPPPRATAAEPVPAR